MQTRKLGRNGPSVGAIGLGCMGMSAFYGPLDDAESLATIDRAIELGVTLLDTSDMYGPHTNEQLLGKALKGSKRDKVVLATKFGIVGSVDPTKRRVDGSPAYVKSACDASLSRLGMDHIDLYYQHRVDASTPIEDTIGAMADLVRAGKIRYIGMSEAGPETLRRAAKVHPIAALQTEYSLWSREPEDGLLALCRELGIGFVAYSPLGRGFLTGQIKKPEDLAADDWRRGMPRFQGENFAKNIELVDHITRLAQQKGVTPGQLALAWVLSRGDDIVPIPGTKRRAYLEENVAADAIRLTADELAEIDRIAPKDVASGMRYPEAAMRSVNL
ncbi:MAG TPA: aldo/keto reductase [Kofleriaceae bacterium]|nr:aldo/keto reductase [Kofleriaceae bacterium]